MTKPLLRGVLKTWKEDRGFGFITPDNGGRDVFIHISAIGEETGRRPEPGDIFIYQIVRDKHGKFRAINAIFENSKTGKQKPSSSQKTKPSIVWLIMGIAVCLLLLTIAVVVYFYFRSKEFGGSLF